MSKDKHRPEISRKLDQLQERYLEQLPGKIAAIEAAWKKYDPGSPEQEDILREVHILVHAISGSAGTFGLQQISNTSRELAYILKTVIESERKVSQDEYDLIENLLDIAKQQLKDL